MTKTLTPEKLQEIYEAAVHEEATGNQDAGFELLCKLEDVGGIGATIRKLIDMVRAANREAQPVGYIDPSSLKTYRGQMAGGTWSPEKRTLSGLNITLPFYLSAPVVPDGYCVMPKALTAENGAKYALSGEFKVSRTVTCNECGGDGCNDCGDAGEFEEEITVPWDTIKEIYRAAVGVCAQPNAAPEVGN